MLDIHAIFEQGSQVVAQWLATSSHDADDMELKRLADICWTRASRLAKADAPEARKWGLAALAAYESLGRRGTPSVAESAHENAAALRAWKLLRDEPATA